MTLKEQIQEAEKAQNLQYNEISVFRDAWKTASKKELCPENPELIRDLEVYSFGLKQDNLEETFEVSIQIGKYAYVTLKPGNRFRVSTTSYAYDETKEGLLDILENALICHKLMLDIVGNPKVYERLRDTYKELLNSFEYKECVGKFHNAASKTAGLRKLLEDELKLEKATKIAAFRVEGQILICKDHWYRTKSTSALTLGMVTRVTPTKIKVDTYTFSGRYDSETTPTYDELVAQGMEYFNKNKEWILTNKTGTFYKNEILLEDFEFLNRS